MKFEIRESPYKFAIFWLSREESESPEFMAGLRTEYKLWKEKGYQPVVFCSGTGSLEDCVYQLIKHNHEVMANRLISAEGTA